MTKIYFDTEFTALVVNPKLISIGCVDESGTKTFYAECNDTYAAVDCSEFCKQFVLLLLEGVNVRMPFAEVQRTLSKWLVGFDCKVILICDSKRDVSQLEAIFADGLPANCSYQVLGFWENTRRRILNFQQRLHKMHELRANHALDDAQVNRIIFSS
jgi:hypothetical protein